MTPEQWLQKQAERQPLLVADIEILPGVILSKLIAEVAVRAWREAQLQLLPKPPELVTPELPEGCRACLPLLQSALLLDFSNEQFLELGRQGIDLRDLSEPEVCWLEGVKAKTVQNWRREGTGPSYRKQGSGERAPVVYSILSLSEWRRAHKAKNTAQRPGRQSR
jgi:hypothetical protein